MSNPLAKTIDAYIDDYFDIVKKKHPSDAGYMGVARAFIVLETWHPDVFEDLMKRLGVKETCQQ